MDHNISNRARLRSKNDRLIYDLTIRKDSPYYFPTSIQGYISKQPPALYGRFCICYHSFNIKD